MHNASLNDLKDGDEDANRTKLLPDLDIGSEKQFVTVTDGLINGRITGEEPDSADEREPSMMKSKIKRTLKLRKASKGKLKKLKIKRGKSKSPLRQTLNVKKFGGKTDVPGTFTVTVIAAKLTSQLNTVGAR